MSYILDALRKAERERRLAKVPTLETVHRTSSVPRRRLWPWVGAALVLVNAAVLIWLLRPLPMPFSESSARSTARPAAPAPATLSGQPASAPPAARAPDVSPHEKPAAPPKSEPSSTRLPASRRAEPERKAPPAAKRVEAKPGPSVALAPAVPKAELQASTPAEAPAPRPSPAAPETPAAATPTSPLPPLASAPAKPAAPPVTPSPSTPAERGTGSLQEMPLAAQEVILKLRLQALVYSDIPAGRLVFINNHKYVEGQLIDDKIVLERITPDGAVLSYQGKRFMLRQ